MPRPKITNAEPVRKGADRHGSGIVTAADFGRALRRRRKELGHTQAEAAALCRVGVRFLSELERGKPTAEIGRALKVAQRLGLQIHLRPRSAGLGVPVAK